MRQVCLNSARDAIRSAIDLDFRATAIQEFLRAGAQVFIVAGAVRDAIALHYEGQGSGEPRDYDIAVANVSRGFFDEVLQDFGRRNRHGGYLLRQPGFADWDVWRLEETLGLKKTGTARTIENALRSFNLDCNAIALNLRTGLFLDAGAIEAIRKKRLGFAENTIRHSADTFAAKALLLHLRSGCSVIGDLRHFIADNLRLPALLHETNKVFPHAAVLPADVATRQRPVPNFSNQTPCLTI